MTDPRLRVTQRGSAGEQAIVAALDNATVRLLIGGDGDRRDVQLMLLAMVDLLGRVFPRIEVVGADAPAHPDLPPGPPTLSDRVEQARANGVDPLDPQQPSVTVAVGRVDDEADLYIDGTGWQSYLGTRPSTSPQAPFPSVRWRWRVAGLPIPSPPRPAACSPRLLRPPPHTAAP